METQKIAVIGAGVMGCGVSLNLALYNHDVILTDNDESALQKARKKILEEFRMAKMMSRDYKNADAESLISRISFQTDYTGYSDIDMVIENISESFSAKERVYKELSECCRESVIYAVNTSCISITKIASLPRNAENVIGVHFMNPVPLKKLVEVIRGYHTSDNTIEKTKEFLTSINKDAVVVNDYPGFVANRMSHLFMNEAAYVVQDGVALPCEVDKIFKDGYGHRMGPLETADLIGLDTVVNSLRILYESYQDPKFRCCPLLQKMVDAGLLGRKSGQGFYTY